MQESIEYLNERINVLDDSISTFISNGNKAYWNSVNKGLTDEEKKEAMETVKFYRKKEKEFNKERDSHIETIKILNMVVNGELNNVNIVSRLQELESRMDENEQKIDISNDKIDEVNGRIDDVEGNL